MKLCVVIPFYNEELLAQQSLQTILGYTRKLPGTVTVLAVNDCSRDRTRAIIEKIISAQPDDHLRLVSHGVNLGYGAANRTGAAYAVEHGYDYALFMDSDLTNHPKYLADFYPAMNAGTEYIKASRYVPGGRMEGVPWLRQLISRAGNAAARLLFGLPIHDCTNGFRAVKTSVLARLRLKENKFAMIVEELYQAKFAARTFAEVPYVLTARTEAGKPSSFAYRPSVFWTYFKYAWKSFIGQRPDLGPAPMPKGDPS